MGEEASGFLMRSLSQPSPTSCDYKEGDPLRALTSSISFGRFMKEPLDWEKWSSFTHNRNLEEVEKFSKPGSVAAKKAYFEAHYKKIAAKKKAEALVEQENEAPNNNSPESDSTNEILHKSYSDSDLAKEQQKDRAQSNPHELNPTNDSFQTSSIDSDLVISNSLVVSEAGIELVSSDHSNVCNMNVNSDEYTTQGKEQSQVLLEETEVNEHCTSITEQSLEVPEVILSESPTKVPLSNKSENIVNHSEVTAIQAEKILLKDASKHGDKGLSTKKRPAIPSSKSSINNGENKLRAPVKSAISVLHTKEESATSNSKKTVRDLKDRKRLTPQSLHMSINFGSSAHEGTKRPSPVIHKIGNAKIPKTLVTKIKERDNTQQAAATRASVNVAVSKQSLIIPQQEKKRPGTSHSRSIRESRSIVGKSLSISIGHSESLGESAKKPKPPTVFSSFVLRSEERAAKRKEFFQKLEEKVNVTEKVNIQRPTKSKIPPTRPRSPNLGRKPSTPSKIQDTSSRPPRGSTFTKTDHSKNFIERNKLNLTRSVTSLPKKIMGENASPNIQL